MNTLIQKTCCSLFIAMCLLASGCDNSNTLFRLLPESSTGIGFNNLITTSDSNNILDYEYLYNGGGVAAGDFNKDGLQDLYFTASMQSNKLYLNEGSMKFRDITDLSGTAGSNRWSTGVSVADVNADGWPDIYVCTSRYNDVQRRQNLLYINQGNNKDGVPVFKEMAAGYGLADTSFSTQAAFFDYDNDGDLDMYLLVAGKMQDGYQPNTYTKKLTDGSSVTNDRLYRNDGTNASGHPHFSDVTREANILIEGFGLGVNITDINRDGWKDIYVTNDYLSNDLLWINNKDGTFTNMAGKYFKHTSYSAMGNDVQDLNNDDLADVITLDMLAKDNYRKKTMSPPGNYFNYNNNDYFGYEFQYVRNTLQLNQGVISTQDTGAADSSPRNAFSEISFLSGVAETDWSWTPLVADFDNDGFRDLVVSNGFPKDLSDQDFLHFRGTSSSVATKDMIIEAMPEVKIPDYAFRNNGDLTFTDVSADWGFNARSFSNGAVYVDLDNDGDLDCVTNNINDPASLFMNTLNDNKTIPSHWLQVTLTGDVKNPMAYGAVVTVYYDSLKSQFSEVAPCRGYLGSMGNRLQFGFGKVEVVDSLRIIWPDHTTELIVKPDIDRLLQVKQRSGLPSWNFEKNIAKSENSLFADVTNKGLLNFRHQETDYIDFNEFRLLPHKFSQYGPSLAVADVNGDGTDDVFIGGSKGFSGQFFLQDKSGKFTVTNLDGSVTTSLVAQPDQRKVQEDQGSLLADLDNDGDVDLYIVSGGVESGADSSGYLDRVYVNDGAGRFKLADHRQTFGGQATGFTNGIMSGASVKAADIDNDGDLDLVRTARIVPGQYPVPASTLILRNDSKPGQPVFTDISIQVAPFLKEAGLVTDAAFTDFDNDGLIDLILVGEWMAPTVLKNTKDGFKNITATSGLAKETGWWNSIVAADFDNDGDIDYVLGNNGMNSLYRASVTEPVGIYAKDFNRDGVFDAIPTLFLPDSLGGKKEYPAFGRDEMMKQMIQVRRKYQTFASFASTSFDQMFTADELKGTIVYHAVNLSSSFVENLGNGTFRMSALPIEAQFAPIFGMVAEDVDGDGNIDLILNGNDYGAELSVGRCAAMNGLVLLGNGKGQFRSLKPAKSGVYIPANGKALVSLRGADNSILLMASQNNNRTLLFRNTQVAVNAPVNFLASDLYYTIYGKNGKQTKVELYYGNSFFSQSSRSVSWNKGIDHIEIFAAGGNKRIVKL